MTLMTPITSQAPTITGTAPNQKTTSENPIDLFSRVTITDSNAGNPIETLTITVDGAGGNLSGTGLSGGTGGVYTLTGSAAVVTTELEGLTFTPAAGSAGTSSTSTFALTDKSSAYTLPTTDTMTTVIDTDPAVPSVTASLVSDTGISATDNITANDAVEGTGLPNATVTFTIDGVSNAATTVADIAGNWSFTPNNLLDGQHTLVASETNASGTGSSSLTFTLETKSPTVTIIPGAASLSSQSGVSTLVTFTFSGPVSGFGSSGISIVGGTLGPISPSATNPDLYTATFTPAPGYLGQALIAVAANSYADLAGNLGAAGAASINITPASLVSDDIEPISSVVTQSSISGTSLSATYFLFPRYASYNGNQVFAEIVNNPNVATDAYGAAQDTIYLTGQSSTGVTGSPLQISGSFTSDLLNGGGLGVFLFGPAGGSNSIAGAVFWMQLDESKKTYTLQYQPFQFDPIAIANGWQSITLSGQPQSIISGISWNFYTYNFIQNASKTGFLFEYEINNSGTISAYVKAFDNTGTLLKSATLPFNIAATERSNKYLQAEANGTYDYGYFVQSGITQSFQIGNFDPSTGKIIANYLTIPTNFTTIKQATSQYLVNGTEIFAISGVTNGQYLVEFYSKSASGTLSSVSSPDTAWSIPAGVTDKEANPNIQKIVLSDGLTSVWAFKISNSIEIVELDANGNVIGTYSQAVDSTASFGQLASLNDGRFAIEWRSSTNSGANTVETEIFDSSISGPLGAVFNTGAQFSISAIPADVVASNVLGISATNLPIGVTFNASANSFAIDPTAYSSLAVGSQTTININYSLNVSGVVTPATESFTIVGAYEAPTISGTHTSKTTSEASVTPFSGVTISDANPGATDTLTITQTGAGTLTGAGNGTVSGSTTTYTLTGTAAAITSELDAVSFTPTASNPDTTSTVTFQLSDVSSAYGTAAIDTTLVTVLGLSPVISASSALNLIEGQATSISIDLSEPDSTSDETFRVSISDGNGDLAANNNGFGASINGSGSTSLSISGSLTAVEEALSTLTDTPPSSGPDTLTVNASDSFGNSASTQQIAVNVVSVAPTITGTIAGQTTTSEATVTPFSSVTITDPNPGAPDALTITQTGAGTLTGAGTGIVSGSITTYTLTGTAAAISNELDALTFTPAAGAPNSSAMTGFNLSDTSSAGPTSTVDTTTTVTDIDPAVAPTITGTHSSTTTSEAPVNPFSGVTITDANAGATDTLTIAVGGTGGVLSGAGLNGGTGGIYTLSGSAATITSELDALTFTATAGSPGTSSTTSFNLSDTSSPFGTPTLDSTTTVFDTDPTVPAIVPFEINPISSIVTESDIPGTSTAALFRRERKASFNGDQLIAQFVNNPTSSSQGTLYVTGQSRTGVSDPNVIPVATFSSTTGSYGDFLFAQVPGSDKVKGGIFWFQLNAAGNYDALYQQVVFDPTAISIGEPSVSLVGSPVTLQSNIVGYVTYNFANIGSSFLLEYQTTTTAGSQYSVQGFNIDGTPLGPQASFSVNAANQVAGAWLSTDPSNNYQVGQYVQTGSTQSLVLSNFNLTTGELTPGATIAINLSTVTVANAKYINGGSNIIYAFAGTRGGQSYIDFQLLTSTNQLVSSFEIATGAASNAATRLRKLREPDGATTIWATQIGSTVKIFELSGNGVETGSYQFNLPSGASFDDLMPLNDGRFEVDWRGPTIGGVNSINYQIFDAAQTGPLAASFNNGSAFSISALPVSLNGTSATVIAPNPSSLPAGVTYNSTSNTFQIDPTAYQLAPSQQETIAINYSININGVVTPTTEYFTIVGAYQPATISGTHTSTTAFENTVTPFSSVTITDPNPGATDTLTITQTGAGTLTGAGTGTVSGSITTYTLTGTAAAITGELDALTFTPTAGAPNTSSTTGFTLSDTSSAFAASTVDATTTVTDTDPAVAPTISGTHTSTTTSEAPITPFSGVTIGDANSGATDTLTITQTGAGTLAGAGPATVNGSTRTYTLTGTAAAITSELDALTFTPTAGNPGTSSTTSFSLSDASSPFGTPTVDATTTVIDTDPTVPTIVPFEINPISSIVTESDIPGTSTLGLFRRSRYASYNGDQLIAEVVQNPSATIVNGTVQVTLYVTGQSRTGQNDSQIIQLATFTTAANSNALNGDILFDQVPGTDKVSGGVYWFQLDASGNYDAMYQQVVFDPTAISVGNPSVELIGAPVTLLTGLSGYNGTWNSISNSSSFVLSFDTLTAAGVKYSIQGFNVDGTPLAPSVSVNVTDDQPAGPWLSTDPSGNYQFGQWIANGSTQSLVLSNFDATTGILTPYTTIQTNLSTVTAAGLKYINSGSDALYAFAGTRNGNSYVDFQELNPGGALVSSFEIATGSAANAVSKITKVRLPDGSTTVWAFQVGAAIQLVELNGSGVETGNYQINVSSSGASFDNITALDDGRFEVQWRGPSSSKGRSIYTQIFDGSLSGPLAASFNNGSAFSISALPVSLNGTSATVIAPSPSSLPAGVTYNSTSNTFQIDPTAYQLAPSQQETVAINYSININGVATPTTEYFTIVGAYQPATISGTHISAIAFENTVNPFSGVAITDPNPDATDTLTITQTGAGTLSGAGTGTVNGSTTTYTLTGTAAAITSELDALTFTPAPGTPSTIKTANFKLSDTSSEFSTPTLDSATVVSVTGDTFTWIGNSGGAWSSASNWSDTTTGTSPATTVPGASNPVTIGGPTGSTYEVITGGGSAGTLDLTGLVDLSGSYTSGALQVGSVQGAPNSATFGTSDGLVIGTASQLSAASATVIDGSVTVSGAGAALSVAGVLSVGTPAGQNLSIAGQTYSYSSGWSATVTVAAGGDLTAADLVVDHGTVSASGTGTTVDVAGDLTLGVTPSATYVFGQPYYFNYNGGQLSVSGGAAVSVSGAVTSHDSSIMVSGSGSSFTTAGTLTYGSEPQTYNDYALQTSSGGAIQVAGLDFTQLSGESGASTNTTDLSVDGSSSIEVGSANDATLGTITVDTTADLTAGVPVLIQGNVVDKGTITDESHLTIIGNLSGTGIVDVGANATLSISGNLSDTGVVDVDANATLSISGNLSGTGVVDVGANATFTLRGTGASATSIDFTGAGGTVEIGDASQYNDQTSSYTYTPYAVSSTFEGFATGDGIIVDNTQLTSAVYTATGATQGTLTLYAGTTVVETLTLTGQSYSGRTFFISPTTAAGSAVSLLSGTSSANLTIGLASDTGPSSTDNVTSNGAVTGLADANATINLTIDGVIGAASVTANSAGVWSYTPSNLADGTHTIVASETNGSGTRSTSLTFTLETTPPTVAVTTADSALTGTVGVATTVTFTFSKPVAGFSVNDLTVTGGTVSGITQSATNPNVYSASFTPSLTYQGQATIAVNAGSYTDLAGNAGSTGSANITVTPGSLISGLISPVSGVNSLVDLPGGSALESFRRPRYSGLSGDQIVAYMVIDPSTVQANTPYQVSLYVTGESRDGQSDQTAIPVANFKTNVGSTGTGAFADFLFSDATGTDVATGGLFWMQLNASNHYDIYYQQVQFDPGKISIGEPSVTLVGSPVSLATNLPKYFGFDFQSTGSNFVLQYQATTSTGIDLYMQGFDSAGQPIGPNTLVQSIANGAPNLFFTQVSSAGTYFYGIMVQSGAVQNIVVTSFDPISGSVGASSTIPTSFNTITAVNSRNIDGGNEWIYGVAGTRGTESYVDFITTDASYQQINSFEISTGDASAAVNRVTRAALPGGASTVWGFQSGQTITLVEINGSGVEVGSYQFAVEAGSTFDTITSLNDGRFQVEWRTSSSNGTNVVNTQIFDSSTTGPVAASFNNGSAFSISAIPASLTGDTVSVVSPTSLPAGVTFNANTNSFVVDPTAYSRLAVGSQQTVTISYTLDVNGVATPSTESFTIVGAYQPPSIAGTHTSATKSETPVAPFSGVTISDAVPNAADTLTIMQTGAGTLTGAGTGTVSGSIATYTLTGTAAAISSELDALTFTPTAGAPNTSSTTGFTLSDTSSAFATPTVDATTTVIDTDPAVAPTISGTIAGQKTTSEAPVNPFSGVTITDANANATDALTITQTGTGTLTGAGTGTVNGSTTTYTLTGTASAITIELDALTFAPTVGAPNTSSTTSFTLSDTSSAFTTPAVDATTTVTDADPAVAPTISGTHTSTSTSEAQVNPFSGVTIGDANASATDTLTITQTGAGTLTGAGTETVNGNTTTYTLTGTGAQITAALDAVTFTPAAGQPNTSATTSFTLSDTSSAYGSKAYSSMPVDLASFSGPDGAFPYASLITDSADDLFGTTSGDGFNNDGTVFELVNSGGTYSAPKVLASFNGPDGAIPQASLIADSAGDLFGTTAQGGDNHVGTVFELVNSGGTYSAPKVLASFNGTDDPEPTASLISDIAGDLFGTTYGAGAQVGTVFELVNSGGTYSAPKVLASFSGPDGAYPYANVITDGAGDLFGTTLGGGDNRDGTVFELVNSGGTYSSPKVLASFNGSDGAGPVAGLITDSSGAGDLFGTTGSGGENGDGTVFELVNSGGTYGALKVLASFNGTDGMYPSAGLITDSAGDLFGTTGYGGENGDGTVFELVNSGGTYSAPKVLASFNGSNGALPITSLITDSAGDLFGTTAGGGLNNDGAVFELANFTPTATIDTMTSVTDTDPAVAQTITGTVAGQTTNSETPVKPFSGVTITDTNANATDTLTITQTGAGTLTGAGTGAINGSTTTYTLTGTAAAITSELDALTFTPTAGAPDTSSTTGFTLSDTSSAFATPTVDSTTTVIDTDPAVAPTISGTVAGQATTSEAPVTPFSGVTIGDANAGATDTLTITQTGAGTLTGAGTGAINSSTTTYTLTGTAAAITSELDALTFTPTSGAPNTSSTTSFTLSDTSSAFPTPTVDATTTVTDIDPAVGPTISGTVANLATTSEAPIKPFASVTITDPNANVTDSLTITFSGPGVLTGTGLAGSNGVYTLSGSAATITSELDALTFTPVDGVPNTSVTTKFTLSDVSSGGGNPFQVTTAFGANTGVLDTATGLEWLNVKETDGLSYNTVSGEMAAGQPFNGYSYATVAQVEQLWSDFGIQPNSPGATSSQIRALLNDLGIGDVWYDGTQEVYGLTADSQSSGTHELVYWEALNPSSDNAEVLAAPVQQAPDGSAGESYGAPFTSLLVKQMSVVSTISVTDTDPAAVPSIIGTHSSTTTSEAPVNPFSGVTITDANANATDALTITQTGTGTLTGAGTGTVNGSTTTYTLTGTASAITSQLDALVFTPTAGALNSSATTAFTLLDTSSAYAGVVVDSTTTVVNSDPITNDTWRGTGGINGVWGLASNWSSGSVPGAYSSVQIGQIGTSTSAYNVILDQTATVAGLTLSFGLADLEVSSTLTITGATTINAGFIDLIGGAVLNAQGGITIGATPGIGNGAELYSANLSGGATTETVNGNIVNNNTLSVSSPNTFVINGSITGTGFISVNDQSSATSGAKLELNGITGQEIDLYAGTSLKLDKAAQTTSTVYLVGDAALDLSGASSFGGKLDFFASSNTVDLVGVIAKSYTYTRATGNLAIVKADGSTLNLTLAGVPSNEAPVLTSDGNGGSILSLVTGTTDVFIWGDAAIPANWQLGRLPSPADSIEFATATTMYLNNNLTVAGIFSAPNTNGTSLGVGNNGSAATLIDNGDISGVGILAISNFSSVSIGGNVNEAIDFALYDNASLYLDPTAFSTGGDAYVSANGNYGPGKTRQTIVGNLVLETGDASSINANEGSDLLIDGNVSAAIGSDATALALVSFKATLEYNGSVSKNVETLLYNPSNNAVGPALVIDQGQMFSGVIDAEEGSSIAFANSTGFGGLIRFWTGVDSSVDFVDATSVTQSGNLLHVTTVAGNSFDVAAAFDVSNTEGSTVNPLYHAVATSDGNGGLDISFQSIVEHPPVANAIDVNALELANGFAYTNPSLINGILGGSDQDYDPLTVTSIGAQGSAQTPLDLTNGHEQIQGKYGILTISNSQGSAGVLPGEYIVSDYQQTVSLSGLPIGTEAADVFNYTISDGRGGTSTSTITIDLNRTPTLKNDFYAIDTNTNGATLTLSPIQGVLTNDTDPDGDGLSVTSFGTSAGDLTSIPAYSLSGQQTVQGQYGTLAMNADGSFTYTLGSPSQLGSLVNGVWTPGVIPVGVHDDFVYTAGHVVAAPYSEPVLSTSDGSTATIDIVIGVPAPQAAFEVDANVNSIRGDLLAENIVSIGAVGQAAQAFPTSGYIDVQGKYGTLLVEVGSNGQPSSIGDYTLNPNADLSALPDGSHPIDSFAYTVSDGNGGTSTANINVALNRAPVVHDQTLFAPVYSFSDGNVLTNDTDPDGDQLEVTGVSGINGSSSNYGSPSWPVAFTAQGQFGSTLTVYQDGTYTYNSNGGFLTQPYADTFSVRVSTAALGQSYSAATETLTFVVGANQNNGVTLGQGSVGAQGVIISTANAGDKSFVVDPLSNVYANSSNVNETISNITAGPFSWNVNGVSQSTMPAGVTVVNNKIVVDPWNTAFKSIPVGQSETIYASYGVSALDNYSYIGYGNQTYVNQNEIQAFDAIQITINGSPASVFATPPAPTLTLSSVAPGRLPTISGIGQPGDTVTIYDGTTVIGTGTVDPTTGAFAITGSALAIGANLITATQTSPANVTSAASNTLTITTVAPPQVTAALKNDTGASNTDGITSDPTLKGTGNPNTLVTLTEGNTTIGTTLTDASGTWTFQPVGLAQGMNVITATQTNSAGDSGSATVTLTLEALSLAPLNVSLASDTGVSATDHITNNGNLMVTGVSSGAQVQYSLDGVNWTNNFKAVEGLNSVEVRQLDLAGNISAATAFSFTLDTIAPTVAITSKGGLTNNTSQVISGTTTANQSVTVWDGAKVLGYATSGADGSWSLAVTLSGQGTHAVSATATDSAGNVGTSSVVSYTLDTLAPAPLKVSLVSDTGASATDRITSNGALKAAGLATGAVMQYSFDGVQWSTSFTPVEGLNSVQVRQLDLAGNVSKASTFTFTLDTIAPTVAITSPGVLTTVAAQTISGTGEAGTKVTVYDGTVSLGTTTVAANGTWSQAVTLSGVGEHTLTARDVDVAGNVGTSTAVPDVLTSGALTAGTQTVGSGTQAVTIWSNADGSAQAEAVTSAAGATNTTTSDVFYNSTGAARTEVLSTNGAATTIENWNANGTLHDVQTTPEASIDLFAFDPTKTTLGFTENSGNTGGTLTVKQGNEALSLALFGQFTAANFAVTADGFGGTLVSSVQNQSVFLAAAH